MKLSAITICVNYGDFLVHTLPQLKWQFNEVIVVTSTSDVYTQAVCEFNDVKCIKTNTFYENGASFNKGNGINIGLTNLSSPEWIVHIDSDIWLPNTFRQTIERLPLDTEKLYGIDRLMCPNYEAWQTFISDQKPVHEGWVYQHMDFFPMGARFVKYKEDGYLPLGFFQLFHSHTAPLYPTNHKSAARTDLQFSMNWDRKNRELIPDIIGIHLESEEREDQSINWNGRKTKPFGNIAFDILMGKNRNTDIIISDTKFWKLAKRDKYE